MDREALGRCVREAWVSWARSIPGGAPAGWLIGWDELDEDQREADMRIGEAVAEAIYAELGTEHYVTFGPDSWHVEHSVICRLSGRMGSCQYHEAVAKIADVAGKGRWRITDIDSEGLPSLERSEL